MPVTLNWMGHRYRVIHANFTAHWDWGDLHQALTRAHILMNNSTQTSSMVLDFLGSIKATDKAFSFPEHGIFALPQLRRFVVIVDEPLLAKELVQSLRRLYPHAEEILAVASYEEAFKPALHETYSEPVARVH